MRSQAKDQIDLFSGIGGFALAARWAGFETVQFVELDPFCQKVVEFCYFSLYKTQAMSIY